MTQCAAVMGSNLGPMIEARRQGQIRTLTSGFALAELVQVQQVLGVQPKLQQSQNAGQILLVYAGLILKVYHRKVSV